MIVRRGSSARARGASVPSEHRDADNRRMRGFGARGAAQCAGTDPGAGGILPLRKSGSPLFVALVMSATKEHNTAVATLSQRGLVRAPLPARQRVDQLLEHPRAAELVAQLPVQDFYYLVKELGLADAAELLALATPEQLQGCLDLDVWDKDRVDFTKLRPWLEVLLEELLPARLLRALEGLDLELLALWLRQSCRIYDRTLEEEPDEHSNLPRYSTPDTFFVIEFLPDADPTTAVLLERLIERLYDVDQGFARRWLMEAKWGLDTELEETAYRWRRGRLEDLGFVEYFEAIGVYAYLDPVQAKRAQAVDWRPRSPREGLVVLPVPVADALEDGSFFARVFAAIEDDAFARDLAEALLALINRVLSADLVEPGETEQVRAASARALATLSLGLEYLADGSIEAARTVLAQTPLVTIFRVGFALTAQLGRWAQRIYQRGIDDPNLDPLLMKRPLFPRAFDDPPFAGGRPFQSLADVATVRRYLENTYGHVEPCSPTTSIADGSTHRGKP
ncbi:MAG: hypothetical protein KatS3mg077_2504 [Candidatus Binatia bacterium]|nr:MAG: hypothetical protein KatS3mg077_2504 [Candidatus Binatia bacterium]